MIRHTPQWNPFSLPHLIASSSPSAIYPHNHLAFQAVPSDQCGDRAERGNQENDRRTR